MKTNRIVVIGAGSASFGLVNLSALMRTEGLKGSELCLVDINEKGLEGISNDYDNYTLTELNEILRTQNIDLLNKNDVKSNLTLQDVLTLKSIIENKVVKI